MELIQNSSKGTFLLYWLLDHKHFLLFSFFTKEELEGTLSWVSHRFNEKVMSILLWRDMMSQISGINKEIEESETVAGDLIENSDLEQEKLNDLYKSCEIIDRDEEKEMQEKVYKAEQQSKFTEIEIEEEVNNNVIQKTNFPNNKKNPRRKFLKEFSLPGEHQWMDINRLSKIMLMSSSKGKSIIVAEIEGSIERIKKSFAKIQSNTPESVFCL